MWSNTVPNKQGWYWLWKDKTVRPLYFMVDFNGTVTSSIEDFGPFKANEIADAGYLFWSIPLRVPPTREQDILDSAA